MMTGSRKKTTTGLVMAAMVWLLLTGASIAPVGAATEVPEGRPPAIIVGLYDPDDLDKIRIDYRLDVVEAMVPSRGLFLMIPTDSDLKNGDVKKIAKELAKDPRVDWAEVESHDDHPQDDRFHAWPNGEPDPVGFDAYQWTDQKALDYLHLDRVHRRATGDGVVVAILDTGVDVRHPFLVDHLAQDGHYDYIDDDDDPSEEMDGVDDDDDGQVDESHGHGTHAAGLVALVAPEAEIVSYRVLDSEGNGNAYVVALAMHDAIDAGADVINISFGMDAKPGSKYLKEAFKRAKKNEVVVVAAVGNNSDKGGHFPAREKEVIGVAASNRANSDIAHFSNYGKPALVAAPGEDIVSTLPGGGFGAWSGTSMAAPIVSGQAALVRGDKPNANLKKVIEIVGKSSVKIKSQRKIERGLIDILASLDR